MFTFNLIDEPWLPCVVRGDAGVRTLSLRQAIRDAHEISELAGETPLVTVSLHRLVLAVIHRVIGPRDKDTWHALWSRASFDQPQFDAYLEEWHHRFDLFGERPFYQVASLDFSYAVPVSKLFHAVSSGNNPSFFDHSLDSDPAPLTPDAAARALVTHQSLALGGLITLEKGQDPKQFKSADAGPLVKCAVFLVRGATLFQTLLLNLHRYDPANGEPFDTNGNDLPAWERDDDPKVIARYPAGYVDLLTWQSRRIRLMPELLDAGARVRFVVNMKGESFPSAYDLHGKETMVAFRAAKKQTGGDPWPPLGFREERALWRDSLILLQVSATSARPRMLDWLADLQVPRSVRLNLEALGLASFRARPDFWRHERLPLPLDYLGDNLPLLEALRHALDLAERAGSLLAAQGPLRRTVEQLVGDRGDIHALLASLGAERAYWASLDTAFPPLLARLPDDRSPDLDGEITYGSRELRDWARTVRDAARDAFRTATGGLEGSGRTLKAVALAEGEFERRLAGIVRPFMHEEVTA